MTEFYMRAKSIDYTSYFYVCDYLYHEQNRILSTSKQMDIMILLKSKRIGKRIVLFTQDLAECVDFVMYCPDTSFSITGWSKQ